MRAICIISADPDFREMCRRALPSAKVMSPSSEQTVEALTTVNAGVVLVDLLHSDEWDYVSRVRDATRARDIPLIVLTGWLWADGHSRRRARELQCTAILPKPCPLALLVDTLKRAAEQDAPT